MSVPESEESLKPQTWFWSLAVLSIIVAVVVFVLWYLSHDFH